MARRPWLSEHASILATACSLLVCAGSLQVMPTLASEEVPTNANAVNAEAIEKSEEAGMAEPTAQSETANGPLHSSATASPLGLPPELKSFRYTGAARARPKSTSKFPIPLLVKTADPYSKGLSADAIQMAKSLHIFEQLKSIARLQKELKELRTTSSETQSDRTLQTSTERNPQYTATRADLAATKVEVLEVIENVRLQIDFVCAEIEEEEAGSEELLQVYTSERDRRVNQANLLAFRTNGVLWAVGEALDIPTNVHPALSIPSGALGIVAGIVPSIFSIYAVRSLNGGHYSRDAYPNMLAKIYAYPTIPRNDYPEGVWSYLNSAPVNDSRSRKQIMMDHWLTDKNIHIFDKGENSNSLGLVTGMNQPRVTINLISDRLTMLREIKAVVLQMTRPLLEISMVIRGQKKLPTTD